MTPRPSRKSVGVVFAVIFVDILGFGIVIPNLAYYVAAYPMPEAVQGWFHIFGVKDPSAVFVGLLQTAYSGLQLVAAPLWGRLSDRIGRKPVLLFSLGGFSVAWAIFAFAPTLGILVAARSLAGAFGANVSTAQAYMADVFPAGERAKGMGLVGMAFGLGFVLGPVIGALLASDVVIGLFDGPPDVLRRTVPALAAAGLSATATVLGLVFLKESHPRGSAPAAAMAPRRPLGERLRAALHGAYGRYLFAYFAVIMGFSGLETMFSQFNLQVLGLTQQSNTLVFAVVGLTLAVVQGGLIGRLTARYGSPGILRVGMVILALFTAAYGWQGYLPSGGLALLILIIIGSATGMSLTNPSVLGLISNLADPSKQGATMGITASAATLGRTLGPLVAGLLYARMGPPWPFTVGAALAVVALMLLPREA
ncbi:MAG: MFS transporter [Myxococcales bacterium]|nr:MFS transporter [Myxococcales bacterium]